MVAPFATALSLGSSLIGGIGGFKGGRDSKNTPIGIGPLFSRLSGQMALDEARQQSDLQLEQSNVAYEEGLRHEAIRRTEIASIKESQAAAFAGTGLRVSGSALGVLEETTQLGEQELVAMRRSTEARSNLLQQDALRILRGGYAQRLGANVEAQQSEFSYANQQRQIASQSRQAATQGLFAAGGLAALGGRAIYNKWFAPPPSQAPGT
jgi:hypothetical protein